MKLKIERAILLSKTNIALKAVVSKPAMPILESLYLKANENGIQLTGNSLDLCIQTTVIEADVEEPGTAVCNARLFHEIIKKLPDGVVEISVDEKFFVTIKGQKIVYKINGVDPADFPAVPEVERANKFLVNRNILQSMIRQTIFAVSEDESKPALTGELVKAVDGILNIVAVDGIRIAHRYENSDISEQTFNVIVPGKSMDEIAKLLSIASAYEDVSIYFTDKQILFELEECTVVSRVITGNFFNYEKPMQINHNTSIKADRQELILCLDRSCLIAVESGKKTLVKFNIDNGAMIVSSETEKGFVDEEFPVEVEGENLTVAFNARLLIDALKAIEDDEIKMQFSGSSSACIIQSVKEGNYKYLVLPLNLDK